MVQGYASKIGSSKDFPQRVVVECDTNGTGRSGSMVICDRLRASREEKKLSRGDIEKRTGLLRCYISRMENGHTVPTVETLEKIARANSTSR